jgi:hypothetical protein
MAEDFAGMVPKAGESTDIVKTVDTTPAPSKPEPPKPPTGWDTKQAPYEMAHKARKKNG